MQLALARDMPRGRAKTAYDPKAEFGEPLPGNDSPLKNVAEDFAGTSAVASFAADPTGVITPG
jgi:hypothetical protein